MKKFFLSLALLLAFTSIGLGQGSGPITVKEVDGSPVCNNCRTFVFPNGSLTVSGNKVTVASGGGGGSGDVVGPASATDNAVARFNLTTGKLIQNSVVLIGDTGNVTGLGTLNTHTIPSGTDTFALLAASQSLTNKKLGSLTSNGLVTTSGGDGTLGVTVPGTGVLTALAVNTGSAGAFVLFDGAGGTPSSLTLTNASGLPPTTGISGWPANASGVLTNNGAGVLSWAAAGGGITIGTTTITSGTNTRVLYNNAGVVGEYTVTGTGNAVLSDSPTITTPAITTSQTTTRNSIGVTSTDGIVLQNTTAAAAGAQQYSPRLRLTGQGWKTNATAESQPVDWIVENQPVQGAANPSSNLVFRSQINGGGYTSRLTVSSDGSVTVGGGSVTLSTFLQAGTNVIAGTDFYFGGAAGPRAGNTSGTIQLKNNGNTAGANLAIGTSSTSPGTSAVGVFVIANGTAPTSSPADEFQLYSADSAAGDANAFARNEAGEINRLTGLSARVSTQFDKTSDTALANVTGLTRNVEAGRTYAFTAVLYTTSNVAGGVKAAIGGTATATSIIYQAEVLDGSTLATMGTARATSLATTVGDVTAVTAARITITGTIVVNAAGTLTVQFAQNASNGTASSVLVNSSFQLIPVS